MAVTINDIARLANVGKSTVSQTLRNHPNARNLRRETREKIRKIAEELGYCSNENAISLRTGKINLIALVTEERNKERDTLLSFNLPGIIQAATAKGYGVKVFTDGNIEETFRKLNADRITKVLSLSVDCLKREESAFLAEKMGMDLVFLFEQPHGRFPSVNVDNFQAASSAVKYLASAGHEKIGFVATGNHFFYQQERLEGFLHAMKDLSLPVEKKYILNREENVEKPLRHLFSLPAEKRPTALFCSTDSLAMKTQHIALQMNLNLPVDLSVVGFSNSIVCPMAAVPLTSMDENFDERAALAVKVLLNEIPEAEYPFNKVFTVSSRIVERESVYDKIKNTI